VPVERMNQPEGGLNEGVWTDELLEGIVANLLRAGVLLSAVVVLGGGICYLLQHGRDPIAYGTYHAGPAIYRTVSGAFLASLRGDCPAIIQLGLLILIATPIARVALSLVVFALQKDRTYVWITSGVLAVLLYALFGKH